MLLDEQLQKWYGINSIKVSFHPTLLPTVHSMVEHTGLQISRHHSQHKQSFGALHQLLSFKARPLQRKNTTYNAARHSRQDCLVEKNIWKFR
ncbi:hypothetical protein CEXT_401091 [Caerostris extrusa]|uniref:Uncharacterized protein n=1 Tax=Caerostris extrusa TaxID=172846 RepID=A0AAV4QB16_CAEEX|nr:hypothetical protein CEXT_401091 [Caerostris extrusa]